jgi:hypothetical protein
MGIKKLINKGNCFNCGIKLIIPTWKWCELHDPARPKGIIKRVERNIYTPQYMEMDYKDVEKIYKFPPGIRSQDLRNKNIFLHDGFDVIGWQ